MRVCFSDEIFTDFDKSNDKNNFHNINDVSRWIFLAFNLFLLNIHIYRITVTVSTTFITVK